MKLKFSRSFLSVLIILSILLNLSISVRADVTDGFIWELVDGSASITGYNGPGGAITVPGSIMGYPVLSIEYDAFRDNLSITSVVVSEGIQEIRSSAFMQCSNLQSISLPDSLTYMGGEMLQGCVNLTSITIPAGVTDIENDTFHGCSKLAGVTLPANLYSLGGYVFYECTSLTSITIPGSVESIGSNVFDGCTRLESIHMAAANQIFKSTDGILYYTYYDMETPITSVFRCPEGRKGAISIPAGISIIGWNAFAGCSKLTSVQIPFGVKEIGAYAFDGCINLSSIPLPSSLLSIGIQAFSNCASLMSLTIPSGVTRIDTGAFMDCTNLASIQIPNSMSEISSGLFMRCTKLTSVTIANTVSIIGFGAFWGCVKLAQITIPAGVATIDSYAFCDCINLTDITFPSSISKIGERAFDNCVKLEAFNISSLAYESMDGILYSKDKKTLVRCPEGKAGNITIPAGVTQIAAHALTDCIKITGVTFPSGLISIDSAAFFNCENLPGMVIPDTVTSIGDSAFSDCSSLTSVTLPGNLTTISNSLFKNCTSLTGITIPANVKVLDDGAFVNCAKLASVILPAGLTDINDYAFYKCLNLSSITLPDSLIRIGPSAFWGCTGLTGIIIPNTVTSIGASAFNHCAKLEAIQVGSANTTYKSIDGILYSKDGKTLIRCPGAKPGSISIASSVINVSESAFEACSLLTGVSLSASLASIGDFAFRDCSSLIGMVIPVGVTSIGESVFENCTSLASITLPDHVTQIGYSAFLNCGALVGITLPADLASIGESAFWGCSKLTVISIPSQVNSIANSAFWSCDQLEAIQVNAANTTYKSVDDVLYSKIDHTLILCPQKKSGAIVVPDDVVAIGESALEGCNELTSVMLPANLISIGSFAFSGCSNLTSLVLPDGLVSINDYAFCACSKLTSMTIPASVSYIIDSAFDSCRLLTAIQVDAANAVYQSVDGILYFKGGKTLIRCPEGKGGSISLPAGLLEIGDEAFYRCGNLTGVTLPDSLASISNKAFFSCGSLTSITIPAGVTNIGTYVFYACKNLSAIIVNPANLVYASIDDLLYAKSGTTLIRCPEGKSGSISLPESVSNIEGTAFDNCANLTSIQVDAANSTYESIDGALYTKGGIILVLCPAAKSGSISIPSTLNSFEPSKFEQCANLTAINIDAANPIYTSINGIIYTKDEKTLLCCPPGKSGSIVLPDGVASIGYAAFKNCKKLTGITLPNSLLFIDGFAFYACSSLSKITIPASVQMIGDSAFNFCSLLSVADFYGDAPTILYSGGFEFPGDVFQLTAADFKIGYYSYNTGFKDAYWAKYAYYYLDEAPAKFTVTFNSNGGSSVSSIQANVNSAITAPAAPTRAGYKFVGWYKDPALTDDWNFTSDVVTADLTLYARWLASPAKGLTVAASSYNSLKLSWLASSGANGYEIYRSTSASSGFTLMTTTAALSCISSNLTTGTTYYYKVRAYANIGATKIASSFSSVASGKPIPGTTSNFKAVSASYNSIKLTWTAVSGATGYQLYRATSASGTYTRIATLSGNATTSYVNGSLATGTSYYYKVRAFRTAGVTTYGSYASASGKPLPAVPGSFKAISAGYSSIKLTWAQVAGSSGYQIYRANAAAGTYSLLTTLSGGSLLSYVNTSLTCGKSYYYKVRAYRTVGTTKVYSYFSPVISAKPIPAVPGNFIAARYSAASIKVSWSAVSGATGYEISRAASAAGTYAVIKTTSLTSYINTGLQTGKTYYYKVRAYRLMGTIKVYGAYTTVKYAKP